MASSTHMAFKKLTEKMKSLTVSPKENNCQLSPTKNTTFEPHPWMNIAAMIVSREEPFKRSSLLSSHDNWMKHFIDQGSTLCESNPVKSMVHNEYIPHGSLQTLTSICYFLLTHADAGSNGYRLNIKGVIMSMTSPISQDMSADLGESIRYVHRGINSLCEILKKDLQSKSPACYGRDTGLLKLERFLQGNPWSPPSNWIEQSARCFEMYDLLSTIDDPGLWYLAKPYRDRLQTLLDMIEHEVCNLRELRIE